MIKDIFFTLLILSVTLISVYGLIIKSINFEQKMLTDIDLTIKESMEYEESFKKIITG